MNSFHSAHWITAPALPEHTPVVFYARKRWTLEKVPERAELSVSADCRFRCRVNGTLIGTGPVRGSATLQFFEVFDVASRLRAGENELFFEVYSLQEENFVVNSIAPLFIAELPDMVATDETWEVQTATAWKSDVPYFTPQSGRMEFHDYGRGVDEKAWLPAESVPDSRIPAKKLCRDPLPPFEEVRHRPVEALLSYELPEPLPESADRIPHHLGAETHLPLSDGRIEGLGNLFSGDGVCTLARGGNAVGLVLDFGAEISGRMELELDAPAGTTVEVLYGESVTKDRIANCIYENYHFTDCFILREGENTVSTVFAERGFRMLQISIRNFDRAVVIRNVYGINRRYPFQNRGSFFSSDFRLNRIFSVCAETLSACSSDVFMDCPWRERAFWVNDFLVNNLATLHAFGASRLHRHCFELAFSQPHETGLIHAVVPKPNMTNRQEFVFAPTNLFMILMLKDYYFYSGDGETALRFLPDVERILNAIWELRDADGILRTKDVTAKWNFYDWSFEENHLSVNGAEESMLSSLFIIAAKELVKLAEMLEWKFDGKKLAERWKLTASNFERRFIKNGRIEERLIDIDAMMPKTCSTQLAHAFWLLTGEASPEGRAICEKALVDPSLLMPDYYLHYFWFRAAADAGVQREALSRIRRYWGRCIDTGSPTLYEAGVHTFGKQSMNGAGSLCHGFGTIPVAFLHEVILGVRPLSGGFKEFSFDPDLMDLEFAEGRIAVPQGVIHVRITRNDREITIPTGCSAILPDGRKLGRGRHKLY